MSNSRTPDWNLSAVRESEQKWNKVGAIWKNDDGSLSIVLDSFVVLDPAQGIKLRAYPPDPKRKAETGTPPPRPPRPADIDDDDIPF